MTNEYGSVENYANLFADIICDVQADSPVITENIIAGFKQAVQQMLHYHEEQVEEYVRMATLIDDYKTDEKK